MIKYGNCKIFYYSQIEKRKSFLERFIWVLTLKMDFENPKMPIFKGLQSNRFTWYQKILWGCLLGCKKLLNFMCLPIGSTQVFDIKLLQNAFLWEFFFVIEGSAFSFVDSLGGFVSVWLLRFLFTYFRLLGHPVAVLLKFCSWKISFFSFMLPETLL